MKDALDILIIDDDQVDRLAICRHLAKAPFEVRVTAAQTGNQARQKVSQQTFDSIFLDYQLPDVDGIHLLRQLRTSGVIHPIIVLTGRGDEKIAVELMKAGATDYLTKDQLTPGGLIGRLRSALRVFRAEQRVLAAENHVSQTNALLRRQNLELDHQRQQIEQQNRCLLEATRIKSEFLATVTHELRTPLNAILGFSRVLQLQLRGPLTDYQSKMVERISTNGEKLLNLVSDILNMAKLETSRLRLNPQTFNLVDLLHDTLAGLRPLADQKGLTVTTHIALTHDLVFNDPTRLQQVLANLISNAIKFTQEGTITVDIQDPAANCLEISVHDTGVGISEDQMATIFQPFYQLDQTTIRQFPGTGLGLTLTHSLVSLMEGFVTVTSQEGQGSVFRVSIPRDIVPPRIVPGNLVSQHLGASPGDAAEAENTFNQGHAAGSSPFDD
jgi:signal transduction histidine kinase